MRIMAIDWGKVRLGIAMSDPMGMIASPMPFIKRKDAVHDLKEILRIAEENEVAEIIIGMPLDIKGQVGKTAELVKKFMEEIESNFDGPVHAVDERYSSQAADRSLLEAGMRRNKRKGVRDGVAAAWILQGFLDSRNSKDAMKIE